DPLSLGDLFNLGGGDPQAPRRRLPLDGLSCGPRRWPREMQRRHEEELHHRIAADEIDRAQRGERERLSADGDRHEALLRDAYEACASKRAIVRLDAPQR